MSRHTRRKGRHCRMVDDKGRSYGGCGGQGLQSAHSANQVAKYLDQIPHTIYVEPFAGHGRTFFARKHLARREHLNDLDCREMTHIRQQACSLKSSQKCDRLRAAKVTCGRDWKQFLRLDSTRTLFYFDPPFEGTKAKGYRYTEVSLGDVVNRSRRLKGKAAISYKNTAETRKLLCRSPFICHKINRNMYGTHYTQLLAVKKLRRYHEIF